MKILITNDDGINAPGIRMLAEWAKTIGDVTVVAPKVEQSGMSHAIQFVKPIEIKKVDLIDGVEAWQMDSTPADCVRFGIVGLKREYDLVLSGINRGVNVGIDLMYSGTVAAIFEAGRLGHRGIAFSTFPHSQEFASQYFSGVYDFITENGLFDKNPIFNVNIPDEVKGIHLTYQGSPYFSDVFEKCDGDYYLQAGSRIDDVCPDDIRRDTVSIHSGMISVTPIITTRTNLELFE
jgi:5'-nucleotidase